MEQTESKPAPVAHPAAAPSTMRHLAVGADSAADSARPWRLGPGVPWVICVGGIACTLALLHPSGREVTPFVVVTIGGGLTVLLTAMAWLTLSAQSRAASGAAAEERLRDFLDTAGDLIEITAPDGTLQYVNQAWRSTFGYTESDTVMRSSEQSVAPEYAGPYHALRAQLLAGAPIDDFEGVFLTRHGRRVVLTVRATCGFEDGRAVAVRSMLRDVTPQRAAEEAQGRLVATLEATTDFVGVVNGRGRAVYINRAGRRMVGIGDDEDVSTLGLDGVFAPEAAQHHAEVALKVAVRDGVWEGESTLRTRDGRDVPVSEVVIAHQSSQGGVWFVSTIMRDISVQKRREQELRDSEQRFRRLSDAATDGIVVWRGGGLLETNRAWCRMFGYDESELPAIAVADLAVPEDRELVRQTFLENRDKTYEITCIRKDGTTFDAQVTGTPIMYKGVLAQVSVVRDISEWKRIDRMKSEFVSTVSHELRTPLTSIRGALGLLESGVTGSLSPQGLDLLRIGRSNTDRLIRLVNDMLDLDKIEAGRLDLRMTTLMPADVVRAAVDGIRPLADQFQIRFDERVEAHRTFEGDRDRVIQVLTNLLSNAVKFSPPESVVTVRAVAPAAAVGGQGTGTQQGDPGGRVTGRAPVRFVVENPGRGIATGDVGRLFRRFQQLDGSDGRIRGGTGLGLAISKAIVEQHGGRIGVESVSGISTTFWFELPAAVGRPSAAIAVAVS